MHNINICNNNYVLFSEISSYQYFLHRTDIIRELNSVLFHKNKVDESDWYFESRLVI